VPTSRINNAVLERRGVKVNTAMRQVRYFGEDAQSWINLQTAFELKAAEKELAPRIEREPIPMAA
jgi:plasmid maintenance system antidote protein VapI